MSKTPTETLREEIEKQTYSLATSREDAKRATEQILKASTTHTNTVLEEIAGEIEIERHTEPKDRWYEGRNHGFNRAAYIIRSKITTE